jgi:hypothetical protein
MADKVLEIALAAVVVVIAYSIIVAWSGPTGGTVVRDPTSDSAGSSDVPKIIYVLPDDTDADDTSTNGSDTGEKTIDKNGRHLTNVDQPLTTTDADHTGRRWALSTTMAASSATFVCIFFVVYFIILRWRVGDQGREEDTILRELRTAGP